MIFCDSSLCVCALVFFSALKVGMSLECYRCNITVYDNQVYGPCQGIATLGKCQDPAVCITVITLIEPYSNHPITRVVKSCYPDMAGAECSNFVANIRDDLTPRNFRRSQKCETCTNDGCNHTPAVKLVRSEVPYEGSAASLRHPPLSAIPIFCFVPFTMRMLFV